MKSIKTIMLTMLAGMAIVACTDKPANQDNSYMVNVNVEGLEDGTVVTLVPMTHEKEDPIGIDTVQNGTFKFTGEVTDTMVVGIIVKDSYGATRFVLEPGETNVTGTVTKSKAWDGTDEYDWDATVSGSPLTEQYKQHMQVREELDQMYQKKDSLHRATWEKFHAIKDKDKAEAFKQTDAYKAAEKAENDFFSTVESRYDSLITANKDTFWGPLLAVSLMSWFNTEQADMYNSFSEAAKASFYGRKMKAEIWPVGNAGEPAKEFTVTGDDGKEVTLKQLLEGKKYLLIDFWASWCNPCRKEIPNVKAQYAKYKDKGFGVVGISIDKDEAAWRKALAEEQLEWPNFRSQDVADLYKVSAVPTVYLLDAEGKIVAQNMEARGEALAAKLAELLK